MTTSDALLRAILGVTARQTFPPDKLVEIVGSGRQLQAFNMCDGTKGQGEVAKALRLDPGNFSRTVARWEEAGVIVRLGRGKEARLLHVYPLPANAAKKGRKP